MNVDEAIVEWGMSPDILTALYNNTSLHGSDSITDMKLNHDIGVFNLNNYETQEVDYEFYSNNKKLPYLIVIQPLSEHERESTRFIERPNHVRLELMKNIHGWRHETGRGINEISFETITEGGIDYYYFFKGRLTLMHNPERDERAEYYLILDFLGLGVKTLNWTTFPKSLIE